MRYNRLVSIILEAVSQPPAFDVDVLATLLVKEAGGEKDYIAGMAGVMNTIVARANKNSKFFIPVALKPRQFSALNNIKTQQQLTALVNQTKSHPNFNAAKNIVFSAYKGTLPNLIGTAKHYHVTKGSSKATPSWSTPQYGGKNIAALPTATIGNHTFFSGVR